MRLHASIELIFEGTLKKGKIVDDNKTYMSLCVCVCSLVFYVLGNVNNAFHFMQIPVDFILLVLTYKQTQLQHVPHLFVYLCAMFNARHFGPYFPT